MLSDVNIALGVTGSIAAVKVVELAHELQRRGATVRGVMTDAAHGIVHPWALEFATDAPVITELTGAVEHVALCGNNGWADVLLIAPATANTVGKIAAATDDTPVTTCATTALGAGLPVVIAPAMHEPMYDHPGVLDAIEQLEQWDIEFVDPRLEEGKAKIATDDMIALEVARTVGPSSLTDRHIVVTSGPTAEAIDPVRIITNRASGKTGRAIARACYIRGADVTLVHNGDDVVYANVQQVESTDEMLEAVQQVIPTADALVSAAALADYTVDSHEEKIRSGQELTLDLTPTPKLIDEIREEYPELPIVGFKTETEGDDDAIVAAARDVYRRANLSFIVANDASVMGREETRVLFIRDESVREFNGSKDQLGEEVADEFVEVL
jgi:phosphopantothenoylcysteine decarboxylase/phosphopantothenate--cysteine ligase